MDPADQRYYGPGSGRFLTPDPYTASGGPAEPGSWNRYAYVGGDPVNFVDPEGLIRSVLVDITPIWVKLWTAEAVNPEVVNRGEWHSSLASEFRSYVRSGEMTDCQALAGLSDELADRAYNTERGCGGSGPEESRREQFVNGFGAITPAQFPTQVLPIKTILLPWYQALNPGNVDSGFDPKYQDEIPKADQSHHFAAFFQLGFAVGNTVGGAAATLYEYLQGTGANDGDKALGKFAAELGAAVKAGTLTPSAVGQRIRDELCKK